MIYIYNKLNIEPEDFDFTLMEALKFYMFITAAKYWELFSTGQDVPESMQFLFLREDSGNLEDFLINHLNSVGDSGGLEMVRKNDYISFHSKIFRCNHLNTFCWGLHSIIPCLIFE